MKLLKLTLLFLLLCTPVQAQELASMMMMGGGGSAAAGPCDGITGTVTYLYNGDYPSDTDAACSAGKVKLDGTVSGATVTANYILVAAGNQYVQHTLSSAEFDTTLGTIWFSMYVVDDGDGNVEGVQIFEIGVAVWDSNNVLFIEVAGDGAANGRLNASYKGSGTADTVVTAADSIAHSTWYRVGYSWQMDAGNDHAIIAIACGGGGTEADCAGKGTWVGAVEVDDDLVEMNAQPTVIRLGELSTNNTMTDDIRVADFYIHNTYKAADTF